MISIFLFSLSHVGYVINEQLITNIFARGSDLCELLIFENGIKNKLCIYMIRDVILTLAKEGSLHLDGTL